MCCENINLDQLSQSELESFGVLHCIAASVARLQEHPNWPTELLRVAQISDALFRNYGTELNGAIDQDYYLGLKPHLDYPKVVSEKFLEDSGLLKEVLEDYGKSHDE